MGVAAKIQRFSSSISDGLLRFIGGQRYLTLQVDITNACNLRCVHCYHPHHRNEGALDSAGWETILDQYDGLLHKLRLQPNLIVCGGEPTLSPMLSPVLVSIYRRWSGVEVAILTNGTSVTDGFLGVIRGRKLSFQVSLDGPDARRHDEVRGPGVFDSALRGIQRLMGEGFPVSILAILSARTFGWIEDFFQLAARLRVESMNFVRLVVQGAAGKWVGDGRDRELGPPELRDAYQAIVTTSRRYRVATNTESPLFHLVEEGLGGHGRMGFQGLVVDYRGNLKVSSRADYILGNVVKEGLEDLFLGHPLMRALRAGQIEECGDCRFYRRCGGNRNAAYATYGSFLARDPGCWLPPAERR